MKLVVNLREEFGDEGVVVYVFLGIDLDIIVVYLLFILEIVL